MKKFYLLLILLSLTSCLRLGLPSGQLPSMSLTNQQIRVGETTTLTFTMPADLFQSGNPDLTKLGWAFIFSSDSEMAQPYFPKPDGTAGFTPESNPQLFPVASIVEVTNPLSPNNV